MILCPPPFKNWGGHVPPSPPLSDAHGSRYKFCYLTSFIRLRRKIKSINNISVEFIMLTDNNQIFRNCFVIIYCHLTKVSSQINKNIIFEPNELSISLSTLHLYSLETLPAFFVAYLRFEILLVK